MLINGVPGNSIHIQDRGLQYGDGVFRTMRICNGRVLHWDRHFQKLLIDCQALNLNCPSKHILETELAQLIQPETNAAAKIIITRGISARGYAPQFSSIATRIISLAELPTYPPAYVTSGIQLHLCQLRLSRQPRLAGVKHLNRLENVLATEEWSDPLIAEGLLLDESGQVIEGTRSNLFYVKGGALYTPDLINCGVAGMQRDRVIEWARQHSVDCHIASFTLNDLQSADEIFMVNSIIGLWPVREMPGYRQINHPISHRILEWLNHENN